MFGKAKRAFRLLSMTWRPRHLLRATLTRSDEPLYDFIVAGGRLRSQEVEYSGTVLPLDCLGTGFWVLRHLRLFLDAGGTIVAQGGAFLLRAPGGLRFVAEAGELGSAIAVLTEVFVMREYDWLDVEDRVVIDIGANIGDTAAYFASRGAVHVYAYEPFSRIHQAAVRNLSLNGLRNVTLERAAIGASRDRFRAKDKGWVLTPAGRSGGETVEILALADILQQVTASHIGKRIVCKVDCEGYEHHMFRRGVADFASVDQWIIEVHGGLKWLPTTLSDVGFDIAIVEQGNVAMVRAWLPEDRHR